MPQRRSQRISSRLSAIARPATSAGSHASHDDQREPKTAARRVYNLLELRSAIMDFAAPVTVVNMMLLRKDDFAYAAAKLWKEIDRLTSSTPSLSQPRYEIYRRAVHTLHIAVYPAPEDSLSRRDYYDEDEIFEEINFRRDQFPHVRLVVCRPVSQTHMAYTAKITGSDIQINIRRYTEILPWYAETEPVPTADPPDGASSDSGSSPDPLRPFDPLSHDRMAIEQTHEVCLFAGPVDDNVFPVDEAEDGPEERENFRRWMEWLYRNPLNNITAINLYREPPDWQRRDTTYTDVLSLLEGRPNYPNCIPITSFHIPHMSGTTPLDGFRRVLAAIGPEAREIDLEDTIAASIPDWHVVLGLIAEAFPRLEVLRMWPSGEHLLQSPDSLPPLRPREPLSGMPNLRLLDAYNMLPNDNLRDFAQRLCGIGTKECVYRYLDEKNEQEVVHALIRKLKSSHPETAQTYWDEYLKGEHKPKPKKPPPRRVFV